MVARAARRDALYANLYAYGIPIYNAGAATPRYQVTCAMEGDWGSCPLSERGMPIPDGAKPSTGSDGVLAVIDPSTNTVGEYWQAERPVHVTSTRGSQSTRPGLAGRRHRRGAPAARR
jgi:hypothetical protein